MANEDWPIVGVAVVADISKCPAGYSTVSLIPYCIKISLIFDTCIKEIQIYQRRNKAFLCCLSITYLSLQHVMMLVFIYQPLNLVAGLLLRASKGFREPGKLSDLQLPPCGKSKCVGSAVILIDWFGVKVCGALYFDSY